MSDAEIKHTIVCVGLRSYTSGPATAWLEVFDPVANGTTIEGKLGENRLAWKKLTATPGAVYEVMGGDWTGESSMIVLGTQRQIGTWFDDDAVTTWTAQHRAERVEHDRLRELAKLNAKAKATLAALNEAYHRTSFNRRASFLAALIHEVTK